MKEWTDPKHVMRFVVSLAIAVAATLIVTGLFFNQGQSHTLYALIRLGLSVVGVVSVAILFVQSLGRIRKVGRDPEQRLRMATIVLILAIGTVLLAVTAIYDWNRPPPEDTVLAVVGVALRTVFSFGPAILVWTTPREGP